MQIGRGQDLGENVRARGRVVHIADSVPDAFSLGNEFSCQPKPGNLRFSGLGIRSPLCLYGVGRRIRPVVDHQFANWWIAPELREGHELDRKIDGHCELTPVDACASLHGG